ncbi:hypothetical protein KIN20_008702 [Parelaphostrongylus tenuis]|uniref:Uncharacterized protein n=1 Tax=Parelaphostrongylus tenuis TaxID=148309 RepID=A0AAD5QJ35_PARTN|nr:hypothetical protein KIN20_008702 [Parelaphostrongylus tenuis]
MKTPPPSSRMDLLVYDCTAEQYALNHVRSCDRRQSAPASRPGYQENIHILGTTATDILGAIQNAIATFNRELTMNGIPSNMIYTSNVSQRQQRAVNRVAKELNVDDTYPMYFPRLFGERTNTLPVQLRHVVDFTSLRACIEHQHSQR